MRIPVFGNRDVDFAEFEVDEFDDAACAFRLEGDAKDMVYGFKFHRRSWLLNDLVDFMVAAAGVRFDVAAVDCVVPVPITFRHRIDRGGFPVGDLADGIARRIGRRYLPRVLARCGLPRRQSSLSKDDRIVKIRGTVRVRDGGMVRGRTVLLVDDILTTGATLSECARMLKAAGVWRVWGVTAARAIRS